LQVAVKLLKLKPVTLSDGTITLTAYEVDEEKWDLRDVGKKQGALIDTLLEIASEYIIKERQPGRFTLAEVEAPGLRVILGDGEAGAGSTIIVQKPSFLRKIILVKCAEASCKSLHEFKPTSQVIVYDGSISVTRYDFDFLIVECEDSVRAVMPSELALPSVKSSTAKKQKKKKARSKKQRSGVR
jgi:hypothetical protein